MPKTQKPKTEKVATRKIKTRIAIITEASFNERFKNLQNKFKTAQFADFKQLLNKIKDNKEAAALDDSFSKINQDVTNLINQIADDLSQYRIVTSEEEKIKFESKLDSDLVDLNTLLSTREQNYLELLKLEGGFLRMHEHLTKHLGEFLTTFSTLEGDKVAIYSSLAKKLINHLTEAAANPDAIQQLTSFLSNEKSASPEKSSQKTVPATSTKSLIRAALPLRNFLSNEKSAKSSQETVPAPSTKSLVRATIETTLSKLKKQASTYVESAVSIPPTDSTTTNATSKPDEINNSNQIEDLISNLFTSPSELTTLKQFIAMKAIENELQKFDLFNSLKEEIPLKVNKNSSKAIEMNDNLELYKTSLHQLEEFYNENLSFFNQGSLSEIDEKSINEIKKSIAILRNLIQAYQNELFIAQTNLADLAKQQKEQHSSQTNPYEEQLSRYRTYSNSLEELTAFFEKTKTDLAGIQKEFESYNLRVANNIELLTANYNEKKQSLLAKAKEGIENAGLAGKEIQDILNSTYLPAGLKQGIKAEIDNSANKLVELKNASALLKAQKTDSLAKIIAIIGDIYIIERKLQADAAEIRNYLKTYCTEEENKFLQGVASIKQNPVQLSSKNPFATALAQEFSALEDFSSRMRGQAFNLSEDKNQKLSIGRLKEWEQMIQERNSQIVRYKATLANAKEYEKRLVSLEHTVAGNITNTIRQEFERIIKKYIDKTLNISAQELRENLALIKQKPLGPLGKNPDENEDLALNAIDPRLIHLRNMYQQFVTLDEHYLNQNLPPFESYSEDLGKCAQKHLQRSMEVFSNQHPFIQWIRKHIIEPLQSITAKIFGKPENGGDTSTFFASQTEKVMGKALREAEPSKFVAPPK